MKPRGCVMSLCFLNIFFDRVERHMNERVVGRGVRVRDGKGEGWEIKQVLYADDSALGEKQESISGIL